jgi:hypothetical protein
LKKIEMTAALGFDWSSLMVINFWNGMWLAKETKRNPNKQQHAYGKRPAGIASVPNLQAKVEPVEGC